MHDAAMMNYPTNGVDFETLSLAAVVRNVVEFLSLSETAGRLPSPLASTYDAYAAVASAAVAKHPK